MPITENSSLLFSSCHLELVFSENSSRFFACYFDTYFFKVCRKFYYLIYMSQYLPTSIRVVKDVRSGIFRYQMLIGYFCSTFIGYFPLSKKSWDRVYEIIRCPSKILAQASLVNIYGTIFYNPENFLKTKAGLLNITKQ